MELTEVTDLLERTPAALDALLLDLPSPWLHRTDGPGTWSAYDIVGHLLHAEATDWLPRAHIIREYGVERPFERFDRESMLDQPREPLGALLEKFRAAREASLLGLSLLGLTDADLDRTGRHPDLGPVTLGQLLATWVAHDLTHLGQIGEVLAGRLRESVGPWRAYLPALDRTVAAE